MKIIHEDSVDWEPLRLRFVLRGKPTKTHKQKLAQFVVDWMRTQEQLNPQKWRFCEYGSSVVDDGAVEAYCELMPCDEVERLADSIESKFDFVKELRLGEGLNSSPSLLKVDWFVVPAREVTINGISYSIPSFSISFTQVTVGQFCEFIDATGYCPIPDKITRTPNYTISHFKLNYGKSPKLPLFGLTYDDAVAFCEWAGFRLPTDPELRSFFETISAQTKRRLDWGGENWTSTPAGENKFFVRNGPFHRTTIENPDPYRTPLERSHYEHLEAPGFRIVRAE